MAERLTLCGACRRHVRCSEVACPFCRAAVSTAPQPPPREPFARLAAAAAVAAGVAALTGCAKSVPATGVGGDGGLLEDAGNGDTEDNGATDAGSGIFFYGAAFDDDASLVNGLTCKSSAGCLPGQVCCATVNLTSSCEVGPCPSTPMLGSLQLCGISAECLTPGDICGPVAIAASLGVMVMSCDAPDGGPSSDGSAGPEGGNADDGASGEMNDVGDTGVPDAPTIPEG
jgi:hypothetical protein